MIPVYVLVQAFICLMNTLFSTVIFIEYSPIFYPSDQRPYFYKTSSLCSILLTLIGSFCSILTMGV